MLEQICPILPSRDFDVTEAFYARLGFATRYKQTGQYLLMTHDPVEVHFFAHPAHEAATCDHGAYLRPADVDAFSAEVETLGLPRDGTFPKFMPAEDKPWGMREAALWDPDGNLLRVGQEIA
ncbi:VOC family protein [Puniceibacterium sp. IMCC21224]|uniref:bleomycin resistance protein n=1 Tax=Puniceibacterium sp. IMCC21224 TaxID=1618204 RepID=UPI00064D9A3F|nr:VOC family protein [Puniceibacterium sp. IMCC21224]KMK65628.1 Glyoxalase-like domain [Puniceibacterium sp. IMCC21224]